MHPLPRVVLCLVVAAGLASSAAAQRDAVAGARPNILWITAEDHGPDLGCYGCAVADTPNLDGLAARGLRFARCWSNAPVCAPARTGILLGVHPPTIGALNMRSSVPLPGGMRPFPAILRELGYFTSNNSKTDYNLRLGTERPWDESDGKAHWRQREAGQPFFAVFNFTQSHESQIRRRPHEAQLDPVRVTVPPLHPDTPEVRKDWAQYHDKIAEVDRRAGRVLAQLREDGLQDDTIVVFFADHGSGMPGYKRTACNRGLHVPLIVHVPERWRGYAGLDFVPGEECEELVSFVDLAPTTLSLAGAEPPVWMQGRAVFGPHRASAPEFLWGYRGRMDERLDCVRTVTDGRYVYVRSYLRRLPDGQHVAYQFQTPSTRVWHAAFLAGTASAAQASFWSAPRPVEQLFDLRSDPHEVDDLLPGVRVQRLRDNPQGGIDPRRAEAGDDSREAALHRLRTALAGCQARYGDLGMVAESLRDEPLPETAKTIQEVSRFAAMCTALPSDQGPRLLPYLGDPDPRLRWWALQGLASSRLRTGPVPSGDLLATLDDPAAAVRVLAAELLLSDASWTGADADRAVAVLLTAADPAHAGHFVALDAWNAMDRLAARLVDRREQIAAIPLRGAGRPARFGEYLERVRGHLLAALDAGR